MAEKTEKPAANAPAEAKPAELKKESIITQAKKMVADKKADAQGTGKKTAKKDGKTEPAKDIRKGPIRVYTVPLRHCEPRPKKTKKAMIKLKAFVLKHTKQEPVIDPKLNEFLWSRGKQKAPAKVRISVESTEDGRAYVSLKK